jgi:centromere protein C
LTLPDTGIRDENGLEPMDHLFSSPEKASARGKRTNGIYKNANGTISSEEDMDLGESMSTSKSAHVY